MTGTFPLCKSILIAAKKVISLKEKPVKTVDLSWLVHLSRLFLGKVTGVFDL